MKNSPEPSPREDRGAFVSAGYYLVAPCPRPEWSKGTILPATLLTTSSCLTVIVPDGWPTPSLPGWRPAPERLRRLGIDPERASEVEQWGEQHFQADPSVWPRPFFDVATLRDFVRRFVDPDAAVILAGVSLAAGDVAPFLAGVGTHCATERLEAIRRGLSPESGGQLAGYEVLGDGLQEAHSVLCTGAEVVLQEEFGMILNEYGLFGTLDDATRAAKRVTNGLGEPVTYFPWRLEIYAR